VDLKELQWEGMDWIHLAQQRDNANAADMVTNLQVP